eukprot:scpid48209/ scgid22594/ 
MPHFPGVPARYVLMYQPAMSHTARRVSTRRPWMNCMHDGGTASAPVMLVVRRRALFSRREVVQLRELVWAGGINFHPVVSLTTTIFNCFIMIIIEHNSQDFHPAPTCLSYPTSLLDRASYIVIAQAVPVLFPMSQHGQA